MYMFRIDVRIKDQIKALISLYILLRNYLNQYNESAHIYIYIFSSEYASIHSLVYMFKIFIQA